MKRKKKKSAKSIPSAATSSVLFFDNNLELFFFCLSWVMLVFIIMYVALVCTAARLQERIYSLEDIIREKDRIISIYKRADEYAKEYNLTQYRGVIAFIVKAERTYKKAISDIAIRNNRYLTSHTLFTIVNTIWTESLKNAIDPLLVASVIEAESGFNPRARSRAGAIGLMQLMPSTARAYASRAGVVLRSKDDIYDIENNLKIGIYYLAALQRIYPKYFLFGYNGGPRAIRVARAGGWYPESSAYNIKVTSRYAMHSRLFLTKYISTG